MKRPEEVLTPEIVRYIEECKTKPHAESYLVAVLQKVQNAQGYLSRESMDAVSQLMQIPAAKVSGVATFYHFFSFTPKGRHRITVCMGTACFVRGAAKVMDRLRETLQVKEGATTADGRFTLESARCLGACALAPIMVVDGKVFGNVNPGDVRKILSAYE